MAAYGRPSLRDLFDESPTPHIAHPPRTHHRDYYVATDGSFRRAAGGHADAGGLGVVIETRDGELVARLSVPHTAPNNNVAEYRALHLGLDVLAARSPGHASVGLLIDHDELAGNVNAATLARERPGESPSDTVTVPGGTGLHWRGIRARLVGFADVRAARIDSAENPAHPLANTPDEYAHVNDEPSRCVIPDGPGADEPGTDERVPPPSRTERRGTPH